MTSAAQRSEVERDGESAGPQAAESLLALVTKQPCVLFRNCQRFCGYIHSMACFSFTTESLGLAIFSLHVSDKNGVCYGSYITGYKIRVGISKIVFINDYEY